MQITDTHSHIYLDEFATDRAEMLLRAEKEGVRKILMPAIDSQTHEQMLALEKLNPAQCFAMMGLHPCSVKENFKNELAIVKKYLSERNFKAVGEIGLDFYWDKTFVNEQIEAFQQQINLALNSDLPIVIHSRESIDQCIEVVKKMQNGKLKGVFHCFSGNIEQANEITGLGFYLGIGGVLTYKKSGLDKVLEQIDMKHIVLETDAPYLTPVPFRGKRNEPAYIKYVAEKLAEVKNISLEEVAAITTANAEILFGKL
ncbi:MAG: TatD family deoxyribonuclease [Bacteroidetes bacterium]|nr:MAG: TatD family deoxyribonuclease [Bacteroidota bacterium]